MQKVYLACARAISRFTERKAIKAGSLFFVVLALFISVSSIISIYAGRAYAAANDTINFQARLLSNTGALVNDGFYTVEFNIYAQETGGTTQWTESQVLTAKNGYLTAALGDVTPFGGSIDWSQEQWLSMNVNGDGEMDPRMKITAVPLAFRAVQADSLTTSTGTVNSDELAQLAPSTVQGASSTNSLLRLNQTGSGGLLQLQASGVDILTLSNVGDLSTARGLTVGTSTSTTAGTIRWSGVDFEGFDGSQWVSLTAGTGGTGGLVNQKTVIKSANEILNNSAILQNDDELSFTIAANEEWAFRFIVQGNSASQPDFQFAVTAPGGATCNVGILDAEGAVAVGNLGCGVTSGSIAGNGTDDVYEIVGSVTNGPTAGNVTLQWAQNSSNANNTTVYAGSYLLATSTTGGGDGTDFTQGGNSFSANAVLGTNDNYALNFITNGTLRMSLSNTGLLTALNGASIANGLTVSSGGAAVTGNSIINGTLSGLTGLTVNSGGLLVSAGGIDVTGNSSVDGVLNINSNGIINVGDITGVGSNITADGGLTISSGGANNLSLTSGSGTLVLDATTLLANNAGITILDLNDTSNTTLSLLNGDGTAEAGLLVEGQISAGSFSGDGSSLTTLNASNLSTGTISDGLLSGNIVRLDTSQSFSATQTLSAGLVLGNTANTVAGTLRWTGTDFEGYDGSQWISLTGGGGGGTAGAPGSVVSVIKNSDENINNSNSLQPDNQLLFAIEANDEWTFRFVVQANSSTTANMQYSITAPSGATCDINFIDAEGALTSSNVGCGISSGLVNGTGNNETYEITGTIRNGVNSGNVILNWSQYTSEASNTTVFEGSYLNAIPVSGGSITPTNAFIQGGNDFGATALLGTTAANDLVLVTGGTARLTVGSTGDVTINNDLTTSGDLTVGLNTVLNGNTTLGDAAGDILTINSNNINISNGLIFDSGTLAIDGTNDFIGINNTNPSNRLSINTPATNDSSAEVLIYSDGTANKALVLQAISGQAVNIMEVQDNGGNSLLAVGLDGSLILGNDTASPAAGRLVLNDATGSNGFTGILGISTLTNNRTINLPDASGTICLSGDLGCGFVALAPGSAQTDNSTNNSLFINKTGASGNLILLQNNSSDVFSIGNDGQTTLRLNSSSALSVLNGSGIPVLTVDTNSGAVRIGNTAADANGTLLVLDTKNTSGDPTGENGGIYYNSSTSKFRCFENNSWRDCIYEPFVKSYVDSTADAIADNNTTDYWDTSAENNNSYPTITPTSASKSIMGIVTIETTASSSQDVEVTARVERGIGSIPSCGSGTSVGSQPGTFSSNNGALKASTVQFIDSPNTTQPIYYLVCSDTATVGTGANMTRIRVTLQEVNNQN